MFWENANLHISAWSISETSQVNLSTFATNKVMAKKSVLKISTEYDFVLAGLICGLPDYRLCWYLNHALMLDFSKAEDITITIPELHIQQSFTRFFFEEEITKSTFWVLQNKAGGEFLLPELKQVDFILLIRRNYYKTKFKAIENKMHAIQEIQTIIAVDTNNLKNKDRLLFE
ncbi:MAG: IPExxxVDY family protein [Bacteroidetes bacterium]|nr:IPExxxVDY family protein [Bacteroidota bacterium]